jgi:hypothetical protein
VERPTAFPLPSGVEVVNGPNGPRFRGSAQQVVDAVKALRSQKELPRSSLVAVGGWVLQVSDFVYEVTRTDRGFDPQIVSMPGHAWNVAASILRDVAYGEYDNPWYFGDVGYLNPPIEPDIGVEIVGPLLVDEVLQAHRAKRLISRSDLTRQWRQPTA